LARGLLAAREKARLAAAAREKARLAAAAREKARLAVAAREKAKLACVLGVGALSRDVLLRLVWRAPPQCTTRKTLSILISLNEAL